MTLDKNPKCKTGNIVRISKCKNIFRKEYVPKWSEEVFVVEKIENTVPWTYVINNLKSEKIVGTFYEKGLQKANQKVFRFEKVIKTKAINYMLNGKATIALFTVALIKNI